MEKKIDLYGKIITYELTYKNVKNLNMRIKPDGSIHVSANRQVSQTAIEQFIRNNKEHILSALEKFRLAAANAPKPREYITGEMLTLCGEEFELKLCKGNINRAELHYSHCK